MNKQASFVNVILPLPLAGVFTYGVPEELISQVEIGKRVLVSFGNYKYYSAIIYTIHSHKPKTYKVKEIINVLDEKPVVNKKQLSLWDWISEYYMCSLGEVMAVALPSSFKLASETKISIHPEYDGDISFLSEREISIINAVSQNKSITIKKIEKLINCNNALPFIKSLIDKNIVYACEEVQEKYKAKTETFLQLAEPYQSDNNALNAVFNEFEKSKRTQKQSDALLYFLSLLKKHSLSSFSKSQMLTSDKFGEAQIQGLIKKGIIEAYPATVSRLPDFNAEKNSDSVQLSPVQEDAFNEIITLFNSHNSILLHGVTGSGKTEIYIKLIQKELDKGKQVLYLLPEIALTTQIINRLRKYFGNKVGVYHSRFNEMERAEIWQQIAETKENNYQIIIGARSALFLPFHNLGLIIVDEEHDLSYKQFEPAPRYQARDTALVLAKIHQAKTLMGSATPSIESYFNVLKKKYALVTLNQRYGNVKLPEINMVDLKKEGYRKQKFSPYTQSLIELIEKALTKKEQIILFQNRRGFSVHLECTVCNYIPICKNCDVTLTYHKQINQLRCHYCGHTEKVINICPNCKSKNIEMRGLGTEKIEEELRIFFPTASIARLDYDSTRSKTAYQKIISDFENRKIDILVGTQMITKGLDFDNVSTVGILNADNLLYFPDFRSHERAFQMLSQVSGRAGRKNKQGKVIIQTFNINHSVFQFVLSNNYLDFFKETLAERQQFNYPPICKFIKITLKHREIDNLNVLAEKLAKELRLHFHKNVLGPEFPPIMKIRNLYHKDIIIKLDKSKNIKQAKQIIQNMKEQSCFKSIIIHIDVDPY